MYTLNPEIRTHGVKVAGAGKGAAQARDLATGLVYRDDVTRCHLCAHKGHVALHKTTCNELKSRHGSERPWHAGPSARSVGAVLHTFSFVSASIILVPRS